MQHSTRHPFGNASTIPVVVNVLQSAQTGELRFQASSISAPVTLEIAGATGVQVLSFDANTKASAIAAAVNRTSDSTGVSAGVASATNALFAAASRSTAPGYGLAADLSPSPFWVTTPTAFTTTTATGAIQQRTTGRDAVASINGAAAIGDGLNLSLNTASAESMS